MVALVLVGTGVAATVVARDPAEDPAAPPPASGSRHEWRVPDTDPPPEPGLDIGDPVPIGNGRHETRWAPIRHRVLARARPHARAQAITRLRTRTPEGTTHIVLALDRREDAQGRLWVRVTLPVLPNGTTGWVPRTALGGYGTALTHLFVNRRRLTLKLYRAGRLVMRAPIGIGRAGSPTPAGRFFVRSKLTRYRSAFYGPVAFGTSARSPTLTDWPGGGFVGIHGTNRPDRLPGRVSHGCIRMRNGDIRRLAREMPPGTPVTIS